MREWMPPTPERENLHLFDVDQRMKQLHKAVSSLHHVFASWTQRLVDFCLQCHLQRELVSDTDGDRAEQYIRAFPWLELEGGADVAVLTDALCSLTITPSSTASTSIARADAAPVTAAEPRRSPRLKGGY